MKRGFKKWFLFLFLLLFAFSVFAASETVSLHIGESIQIKDVNFTLLRTSEDDEKIVMCINNIKVIVSDTGDFGNSVVRVNDVFSRAANLEIEVTCGDNCKCGEDCNNDACFVSASEVQCSYNSDCDDANSNTIDLCVSGVCENRPVLKSCTSNVECDDGNQCTIDSCNKVLKKCTHVDIENCSQQSEQPVQEQPASIKSIPTAKLSTYMLLVVVAILVIALVIKRVIK